MEGSIKWEEVNVTLESFVIDTISTITFNVYICSFTLVGRENFSETSSFDFGS